MTATRNNGRPDVLTVACPQCRALPGQKCRNYKGQGCAPHRLRVGKCARCRDGSGPDLSHKEQGP